jgi:hypothetical protein
MLVVYQSLESTGTKGDTAGTAFSGNRFKALTQNNAGRMYPMGANKVVTYQHPVFDSSKKKVLYEDRTIQFATGAESKALSNQFKKTQDKKELLEFLEGVIDSIKRSTMNRAKASSGMISTRTPEIIVLGEINGGDLEGENIAGYEVIHGMNPTGDARHRFMVLKNTHSIIEPLDIKIHAYEQGPLKSNKDEDAICMMLELKGWLMAFVHTPNSICGDKKRAPEYIKNNILRATGGTELDLLIGDTNQPSSNAVKSYMHGRFGGQDWMTSIHEGKQEAVGFGGHQTFSMSGTNSGFDTHFDIACTRHTAAVIQNGEVVGCDPTDENWRPVFVFHGLTDKFTSLQGKAYAYSDHNGIIIEILSRKNRLAYNARINTKRVRIFKADREFRRETQRLSSRSLGPAVGQKRRFDPGDDAPPDDHFMDDESDSDKPVEPPLSKKQRLNPPGQ